MRWLLGGLTLLLAAVFARAAVLEATQGEGFREEAARALMRHRDLPGVRGRILARDGSVLACDEKTLALAVHYRYLEEPPDPRWLRLAARSRLMRAERRDPTRLAAEQARFEAERHDLKRRLAALAGLSDAEWSRRAARVQARVERIAQLVNRRQAEPDTEDTADAPDSTNAPASRWDAARRFVLETLRATMEEPAPSRIVVAEEMGYHVMAEGLPLGVAAEIEAHPREYPGVKIVEGSRRSYPAGATAAHLLGYTAQGGRGPGENDGLAGERVGQSGVEKTYDDWLRGRRGAAVEVTDHGGRVLSTHREQEPGVGRDLVLTIDPALQRTAEELLAAAIERRTVERGDESNFRPDDLSPDGKVAGRKLDLSPSPPSPGGGAILVMDVRTGAVLAAASAPGFDPNLFSGGDPQRLAELLADPGRPLFDRTVQMAVPPGSVFKVLTSIALLESAGLDPYEPFACRGYLHDPEHLRCQVFADRGVGHGEVTLLDALAQSCNVYFFHHAARAGAGPLVHWAACFGFGQASGMDLPCEAAGNLPSPRAMRESTRRAWRDGDTQMTAIGQGQLEVTPVQVARLMAAVANGGLLVTPHVASRLGLPPSDEDGGAADLAQASADPIRFPPPRPIPGLKPATLDVVRQGLKRVVADHLGTAHATVHLDAVEIAGKTGTAQTGAGQGDHAWFAGYAPADEPRVALVVALAHAGSGGEAAGPVAKRLVIRLDQLGYLKVYKVLGK